MIFVGSIKKGTTGLITAFIIFLLRHLTFSHFFVQPSLPVIISKDSTSISHVYDFLFISVYLTDITDITDIVYRTSQKSSNVYC